MKKRTWIYVTVALLAMFGVFATMAYAQPSTKFSSAKSGWNAARGGKIGSMLGISDKQKDEIRGVLESYKGEFRPLLDGMIDAQRNLRDTVTADSFNESAIRKASDEVGRYRADLAVLAGRAYQDVSKILTTQQLEKIDEFKEIRQKHVDDLRGFFDTMPVN